MNCWKPKHTKDVGNQQPSPEYIQGRFRDYWRGQVLLITRLSVLPLLLKSEGEDIVRYSVKTEINTNVGSGNKNAIALLLRNNIPFRIFAGSEEIHITTRRTSLRGVPFDIIQINGKETSLTVQMGPQWELWFAIREIYSNAIDEGNPIITETNDINSSAGKTRFYILITDAVREVLDKWDTYFSFDRTDMLFQSKHDSYPVIVYPNLDISGRFLVYRKGILVSDGNLKAGYSYDLDNVIIDESRVLRDNYSCRCSIVVAWLGCALPGLVEEMLVKLDTSVRNDDLGIGLIEKELSWHSYDHYMDTEVWRKAIGERIIISSHMCGMFLEEQKLNSLILPPDLCRSIADQLPQIPVYGISNAGGITYIETQSTPRNQYKLQKVIDVLHELNFMVTNPVKIVKFIQPNQLGMARNGFIMISEKHIETGTMRDIALTVLEEYIHINEGHEDMSRNMQNYLLTQWLSEREEKLNKFIF